MSAPNTSAEFFESLYRGDADPWNFECSAYEQNRYTVTIDALRGRRFDRGFEPGCSIGVLTEALAPFCKRLDAIDISPSAVCRAQQRCRGFMNVGIEVGSLPEAIPDGKFDLIVFSEIGYYFVEGALRGLIERLTDQLEPRGIFLAVHWLGISSDHVLTGDQVHELIRSNSNLVLEEEKRFPSFRLDKLVRQ